MPGQFCCYLYIICIFESLVAGFIIKSSLSGRFKVESHRRYLDRVRKIYPSPPKGFGGSVTETPNVNNSSDGELITNLTKESEKQWLARYPYLSMHDIWDKFNYPGHVRKGSVSGRLMVSKYIKRPNYYKTGTPLPVPYENSDGLVKSETDIHGIKKACLVARKILDSVHPYIRTGIMTDTIDRHVHRMCDMYRVYPSPLRYKGFPKSVCISINEIVCHGIPDSNVLSTGDFVNVDVTVYVDGYHGDVSETFLVLPDEAFSRDEFGKREPVSIGGYEQRKMQRLAVVKKYVRPGRISQVSLRALQDKIGRSLVSKSVGYYGIKKSAQDANLGLSNDYINGLKDYEAVVQFSKSRLDEIPEYILPYTNKLLKSAYNATMAGIAVCGPGVPAIGEAIQSAIEKDGYYTTGFLVGHGIGRNFHEEPTISFVRNDDDRKMVPGMVFTIEPIIFEHECDVFTWPDGWTITTQDGSRTAQYEHTVLITHTGVEILTKRLQTSPNLFFLDDNQLINRIEKFMANTN